MEQSLNAGAEVHKRTKLADGRHASRHYSTRDDPPPHFSSLRLLLLFEQRASRNDQGPAAVPVLDDPESVDPSFVLRGVRIADGVDLRSGAERPLPPDADFVSSLHGAFDPAFHRKTGVERVFELTKGCGSAREPAGQPKPARCGNDHCLHAVADGDL